MPSAGGRGGGQGSGASKASARGRASGGGGGPGGGVVGAPRGPHRRGGPPLGVFPRPPPGAGGVPRGGRALPGDELSPPPLPAVSGAQQEYQPAAVRAGERRARF